MLQSLALLLALTSTPQPTAISDPYAIYKRAAQRLDTLADPQFIDVKEHWIADSGGMMGPHEWDERAIFRSADRMECLLQLPFDPKTGRVLINHSQLGPDVWLMRGKIPPQSEPVGLSPDTSDLRTIAAVVAVASPVYDIRLVGIDQLTHGGSAYHLALQPKSDPLKHNLRHLWVNTQTYDIARAVIDAQYAPSPNMVPEETLVTEDFGRIGPYWMVIHWGLSYRAPFSPTRTAYDVSAETMAFPESMPDWYFDKSSFDSHRNEVARG